MQRHFKIIGVVAIVTLILMAAGAKSSAQTNIQLSPRDFTDITLCSTALNAGRSGWDNSSDRSLYVAEATRRRLTPDACRQLIAPANTQSGNKPPSSINHDNKNLCEIALNRELSAW